MGPDPRPHRRILIVGGGIAGLTAALAFAGKGFEVTVAERAERLQEVGAGLQLSPNATRILSSLNVLDHLLAASTRPRAVTLRDAVSLAPLAEIPLGLRAEKRWKAPYLVLHRTDLQAALLDAVAEHAGIELMLGTTLRHTAFEAGGPVVALDAAGVLREWKGDLLIGADGVWSATRRLVAGASESRPSGNMAWRATLPANASMPRALRDVLPRDGVTAFLHPAVHLIAYPVKGGAEINLAALMKGNPPSRSWSAAPDIAPLRKAMARWAPPLAALPDMAEPWTAWPIHAVNPGGAWIDPRGIALAGDAAHAMTPFAAQGAAMAIEDAAVLAAQVASLPDDLPKALDLYQKMRRDRVRRVARRGALNHFAWHASGPVALARNFVLRTRSGEKLAADLDWLYGWDIGD